MAFGNLRLSRDRREVILDGVPVDIGGRAFDVLEVLVQCQGRVVTKDELFRRVWPATTVEENNLHVHVSALRKALGASRGMIQTVSGRGYRLASEAGSAADSPTVGLPAVLSSLVGRERELPKIAGLVARQRIVTLTGAFGVGKTCLALEVARHLSGAFSGGVGIADLSVIQDPGQVAAAIATALGHAPCGHPVSAKALGQMLAASRVLLVLDNCEHVIDAAASCAEAIARAGPGSHLLVTSRERLRADGEQVYQVQPLQTPSHGMEMVADPARYGAMRLFIDRAASAGLPLASDPASLRLVAAISRHLDGLPLAIEMAACRAANLGIGLVAERLDDRFSLLSAGRRTAPPRHRSLRAALDHSHCRLSDIECCVLRRLSVFPGVFSLSAARQVVGLAESSDSGLPEVVSSLVVKSLVVCRLDAAAACYQLLETVRAYAAEKLRDSGEHDVCTRRYLASQFNTGCGRFSALIAESQHTIKAGDNVMHS
jgi:predicted ATPase/DNA-binding winged helix-turn-helix (wHTH) protein